MTHTDPRVRERIRAAGALMAAIATVATAWAAPKIQPGDPRPKPRPDVVLATITALPSSVDLYEGGTASATLTVTGFDASKAPWSANGLPWGVTARFAPVDAKRVRVELAAGAGAWSGTSTSSTVSFSGGSDASVAITVRVPGAGVALAKESYRTTLAVTPCTTSSLRLLVPTGNPTSRVALSLRGAPPLVTARVSPQQPVNREGLAEATLTVRTDAALAAGAQLTLEAAVDGAVKSTVILDLKPEPGSIVSFSPDRGHPPELLGPGTIVTITGKGLCPGATVSFAAGDGVVVPATSVNPEGTELVVSVPRYAVSGPLRVFLGKLPSLDTKASFTVADYRATHAFNFVNDKPFQVQGGGGSYGWDDADVVFGDNAYFTAFGERVAKDLLVNATLKIADWALSDNGLCWGFIRSSQIIRDERRFRGFPNPGTTDHRSGGDIFHMPPTIPLARYLHGMHVGQLSVEFAYPWVTYQARDAGQFITDIRNGIKDGGVFLAGHGHVLEPYDIDEAAITRNGKDINVWRIHTYNPNVPWDNSESTLATHQLRMAYSTVFVDRATGQYWFDDDPGKDSGNHWGGTIGDLSFLIGVVPRRPLPRYFTPIVSTSLSAVAGAAGTGVEIIGKLFAVAVGKSASVQISDSTGRTLFKPDGTINTDPRTRLPNARPFAASRGGSTLVFVRGDGGSYSHTLTARAAGPYEASILSSGYVLRLGSQAPRPGAVDRLTFDHGTKSVDIEPDAERPLRAQMLVRIDDKTARSLSVDGMAAARARSRIAFDRTRGSFRYTHAGRPGMVTLELEEHGKRPVARKFAPVPVDTGDELTIDPEWSSLGKGKVPLRVRKPNGVEQMRQVE